MLIEGTDVFFTNMIGTLAVILVVAAFVGGSDLFFRLKDKSVSWKYQLVMGVLGGFFGVYGNLSGVEFNGAVISVRDIGPMIAGFTVGPVGGLIAGLICGGHRLLMGGITAPACVVATCCIGLMCGYLSQKHHRLLENPGMDVLVALAMELFHLGVVLVMVKPFSTAWGIVRQIAIPFLIVNAVGFAMMVSVITYIEKYRKMAIDKSVMESELQVASVIQRSLLPDLNETYPGRKEIDVRGFIEPAKTVGGDFYDVFFVDNNRVAFVIGDVSGKGIPASLFMATGKTIMQNCVRDIEILPDAIATANNVLCARNDADMFITAWIGVLDLTTLELRFVSAGHNPPVLKTGKLTDTLKFKNSFILGGMENAAYHEDSIFLQKGDILVLYTDGVIEAENKAKELYGEKRMLDCLKQTGEMSTQETIGVLKKSVDEFVNGHDQFDDITILCIKINE